MYMRCIICVRGSLAPTAIRRAMDRDTKVSDALRDPWLLPAFLGVARLPINNLNFEHEIFKKHHRPVSEKILTRLRSVFQREGFLRSKSKNWIDAVVEPQKLLSALAQCGKTRDDISSEKKDLPILDLGTVDCLQGVHRILAAADGLNPNDQWWTVRLYSRGEFLINFAKIRI